MTMTRSFGSSSRKAMVADIVTTATAKDNVPSGLRLLRGKSGRKIRQLSCFCFWLICPDFSL